MCCDNFFIDIYNWFLQLCNKKKESNKESNDNPNYLRYSVYEMKKKDLLNDNEINEINKINEINNDIDIDSEIVSISEDWDIM